MVCISDPGPGYGSDCGEVTMPEFHIPPALSFEGTLRGTRSGRPISGGDYDLPFRHCDCDECEDYRDAGYHEYCYQCVTRHRPDACPPPQCAVCRDRGTLNDPRPHTHCLTCQDRIPRWATWCDDCARVSVDEVSDNRNDHDDDDDPCDCEECRYRANSDNDSDCIHDYGYKPMPIFYGTGPLYLGMELELEIRNTTSRKIEECAELANDALGHGDLGYLKYDGSLRYGFEIVTHPMSYPYFVERFPWEMLRKLREEGGYTNSHCGIHVHVSRAGFKGESHQYKWLAWWHRSKDEVTAFARRDPEDYASFNQRERQNVKQYAKGRRYGSRWSAERYSAVNVTPPNTYEVRVFRSTLDKIKAQACLGLVDSSVKYADKLRAHDALKNGAWGWSGYRSWLFETDTGLYSPLRRTINRIGV